MRAKCLATGAPAAVRKRREIVARPPDEPESATPASAEHEAHGTLIHCFILAQRLMSALAERKRRQLSVDWPSSEHGHDNKAHKNREKHGTGRDSKL